MAFFGLGGGYFAWAGRRWIPILEADEKQIALPRSGAEIDWVDVARLRLWTQSLPAGVSKDYLSVVPADDSRIRWRRRGWRVFEFIGRVYGDQMSLPLDFLSTPPADEVIDALRERAKVPLDDEREG